MEIEYAKFTPTPTFVHRYDLSPDIIKNNELVLIQAYNEYKKSVTDKAKATHDEYDLKEKIFKLKKCQYCGSKLTYNKAYDFWGCSNYKAEGQHSTFSKLEPIFYSSHVSVEVSWLSNIIEKLGFKGKLKAKPLYEFYLSKGLSDLRTDFGFSSSEIRLETYSKVKKRSTEQELIFKQHFETLGKVAYQQCIIYKLKDKKEAFCIPDFILGTKDYVKIIDAKLDFPNDNKMDLYTSLIEFIIRLRADFRLVKGAHAYYKVTEGEWYNRESKYETILL